MWMQMRIAAALVAFVVLSALTLACAAGPGASPAGVFGRAAWGAPPSGPLETMESSPNVIMFIGDGMGFGHVEAGRNASAAVGRALAMDSMPVRAQVSTLSYGENVTDSAAAATAMATGCKTINTLLGVDWELQPVTTILEAVRDSGGRTALVTNCAVTGATPAAFAVHVDNRDSVLEIASALVATGPDIMLGGGYMHFASVLTEGDEPVVSRAARAGYSVARTMEGLAEASALPLLGLFADDSMQFAMDRDPIAEPSLAHMAAKAIELLTGEAGGGGRGFFLMVENDLIDVASHDNDALRMTAEVLAFDEAVGVGLEFARSHGNTLVIVVADHETGTVEVSVDGSVEFGSDYHSARCVPLFAEGPGQHMFAVELLDNTEIAAIMAELIGVRVGEPLPSADNCETPGRAAGFIPCLPASCLWSWPASPWLRCG